MEIRPIRNAEELDVVYRLAHDCYVEKGYCQPQPDGRFVHYPHLDRARKTTILVAAVEGQIVSTISLTLDGPQGLPEDIDFPSECNRLRKEGRVVAAAWRLVTRKSNQLESSFVMKLYEETARRAMMAGVTSLVFVVAPCHQEIYRKLFHARVVVTKSDMAGLTDAPGILLRIDYEDLPERLLRIPEVADRINRLGQPKPSATPQV